MQQLINAVIFIERTDKKQQISNIFTKKRNTLMLLKLVFTLSVIFNCCG